MCGIAGILRYDDALIDRDELQRMATWLTHRGPDDANTHVHGRCGLAHTRLSIIDLSDGVQPMHAPAHGSHGPLTVIFNGEIYNHRKLRHDLSGRGHVFTTNHSDTEVLLHGYRQWGRDLPSKLSGMFAFAIWNEDEQTLFLARDRVGKKPLFYSDDGVKLTFASEIGPIVASMRDRQVNHSALNRYLRFGYCGYESLAAGVMELAPAHWMEIAAGRRTKSEQYWSAASAAESSDGDSIEQVLQQAVSSRLEADVPLGCFLSGGIDSSLVAALAQQSLKQQGNDTLKTFSVRMPVSSYDESEAAAAVARHISSEHVQLEASADADIIDDLVRMTSVYGEPTADSSILPTFWLSRATRPHVKAVLSGDGGDELFGGYDRYRALRILAQHRWWVKCLPTWLLRSTNPKSKRARLRRLAQSAQHATPPDQYQSMIHLFTDKQIEQLLLYERSNEKITVADKWPDEADNRRAAMQWDFAHYLPMEVLRKVDRASMAVGLEVRCPLLDERVVLAAAGLSMDTLLPRGRPKGLLRDIAAKHLPPDIITRPKQGFAVPVGHWLRETLYSVMVDLLTDGTLKSLGLQEKPIERLIAEHCERFADHTHRLFALIQLSLWAKWYANPQPLELT